MPAVMAARQRPLAALVVERAAWQSELAVTLLAPAGQTLLASDQRVPECDERAMQLEADHLVAVLAAARAALRAKQLLQRSREATVAPAARSSRRGPFAVVRAAFFAAWLFSPIGPRHFASIWTKRCSGLCFARKQAKSLIVLREAKAQTYFAETEAKKRQRPRRWQCARKGSGCCACAPALQKSVTCTVARQRGAAGGASRRGAACLSVSIGSCIA